MAGIGSYNGWRWIFIIEGLMTVTAAAFALYFLPDWPGTTKFLKPEERTLLLRRLQEDSGEARMDHMNLNQGRRILADWKIWIG